MVGTLGDPDGVLVVDETGFLKRWISRLACEHDRADSELPVAVKGEEQQAAAIVSRVRDLVVR